MVLQSYKPSGLIIAAKTKTAIYTSEPINPINDSVMPAVVKPLLIGFFLDTSPRIRPTIPTGIEMGAHKQIVTVLHNPTMNDASAMPFD